MKNLKLFVSIILSLAIALSLAGCRASVSAMDPTMNSGETIEFPTEAPTETTSDKIPVHDDVPDITLDPDEPQGAIDIGGNWPGSNVGDALGEVDQELKTLRVQDVDQSVIESLIYELSESSMGDVPMAHLRDRVALVDLLETVGSACLEEACAVYDETFFASYDLLVIPRVTNTGSARYSAQVMHDGASVVVRLNVEVPEIVTMDMANWCLIMAVPKEMTQGGDAVAIMTGGMSPVIQEPVGSVGR